MSLIKHGMSYREQVDSIIKHEGYCHLPYRVYDGKCTGCFYPLFSSGTVCYPDVIIRVALLIRDRGYDYESVLFDLLL